ncbi:MAG TPA: Zeta toxin family protein [Planctomycetota bacterium]
MDVPSVIALAGPNGAGKSTAGPSLVRDTLGVVEYVDADVLARADPGRSALSAGRSMIRRLRELAEARRSFAFETTLASRTFAPWIDGLLSQGWRFDLFSLWIPSPNLAVARVDVRVRGRGHSVPEEVIRRRFRAGLRNFFRLYRPLATSWGMYDNSGSFPRLITQGVGPRLAQAVDGAAWARIETEYGNA